jgi:hypothetical protein
MADIAYTTLTLPPAYLGIAYEAAIAYSGAATLFTAQSIVAGTVLNGLPAGLALDLVATPGSLRITGTPTGAASGGNTPKSGLGPYTFTVSGTDTAGTTVSPTYTINLLPAIDFPPDFRTLTQQLHTEWPTEF